MSKSIAVERIQKGDRIEIWHGDRPQAVFVDEVAEGATVRTLQVSHQGGTFELNVPRGYSINLVC